METETSLGNCFKDVCFGIRQVKQMGTAKIVIIT